MQRLETSRPFPIAVAASAVVLLLVVHLAPGCGEPQPPWWEGLHDLSRVPVSAELAPAIAAAAAALDAPPPTGKVAADLARYEDLVVRLKSPTGSRAAGDEVYRLWEKEPANFLWIELAKNNDRHLRRTDDLERMCASSQLSDTTTALGAYVAGRLRFRQTDRGRMYRLAESRGAELDTLQRIWLGTKLAAVDFGEGDVIGAVRRLIGWLPSARRLGGPNLETLLWSNISSRLTSMDRLDDALHAATMAAAQARRADNDYRELRARLKIADVMEARQEYAGALERIESTIDDAERGGYVWAVQSGLSRAAGIATEQGDYAAALAYDRRNLAITAARNDPLNLPRNLASVAHDHRMLGDLDSCRVYLQRAASHVDADSDRRNRSRMASLLAEYHCLVGEYETADSLIAVARGLGSTAGTEIHEAGLLLELIPDAIEMGQAGRAYAWLARVAELQDSLRDGGFDQNLRADFEILTTRLLAYQGEFGRAFEALQRAEHEVEVGGGEGKQVEVRLLAGELAQLRGDLVTARDAFSDALARAEAAGHSERISQCRFRLANTLLEQGRFERMRALFTTPDGDEAFGPRFRNRLSSLLWLGMSHAREGDHERALERYDQALALSTPSSPADLIARIDIEKGRSLLALGRTNEGEALLAAVHASVADGTQRSTLDELRMLPTSSLRDAAELLIGLMTDHHARSAGADLPRRALDLAWPCLTGSEEVRSAGIGPDAVTGPRLFFFVGRDRSFAWAGDAAGLTLHELPGRTELRRRLVPLLADLSTPGRPVDAQAAADCADLLLGPAAAGWPEGSTLTVLPDDLLHDVPWAGLALPPAFGAGAGRVALEHGPVVQARSAPAASRGSRPVRPADLALLAVGCDRAGGSSGDSAPDRLRQAEREARRTAAAWPGPESVLRTGPDAAWNRIVAADLQRFGVIHFATHAVVQPGRRHRSTLRLAAGDGSEPVTLDAVTDLRLDADLVFLACCNAARRFSTSGGGASDFADAFLAAGARTVIASTLWVDDEFSLHLAEAFYRNWQEGPGKAEALRAALLETRTAREEWRHPAYWAFYRLIGDPD